MKRRLLAMVLSLAMLMGAAPHGCAGGGQRGAFWRCPVSGSGPERGRGGVCGKFTIYKDGVKGDSPKENVQAGQLSETAPDLTGENLYFDHAEVNGKRVYEAGTLTGRISPTTAPSAGHCPFWARAKPLTFTMSPSIR